MIQLDQYFSLLCLVLLPFFFLLLTRRKFFFTTAENETTLSPPVIDSTFFIGTHKRYILDKVTALLRTSSTSTIAIRRPLGTGVHLITANPANVEHILKTKFSSYPKSRAIAHLGDLLGGGIFNADGEDRRFQRQVASYESTKKSLRKFVVQVVDAELYGRLIPILEAAAAAQDTGGGRVFDLQDLLKRFAFDNICNIAFGHDPQCLLPSLPDAPFATAFEEAVALSSDRSRTFLPLFWKIKRFLNIGSEKKLRRAVVQVRDYARSIVKQKINVSSSDASYNSDSRSDHLDLLSRFLNSGHNDEQFVTDIAISFILAGRDTTSAALTWFFWLLTKNPDVEERIVSEIRSIVENQKSSAYDEAKRDLIYTQAALFESMRLYPPVPVDSKQATDDDIWPDGTTVKAGTVVVFHIYAMGRMERIWGPDWADFKPERWLEMRDNDGESKLVFAGRDPFSYPVFQAGPRICLGKEMAILQMKRVIAGILKRFRVIQAAGGVDGYAPAFLPSLTAKMEGGFPVRFESRR